MVKPGPGTPVPEIIDDPKLRSPFRNFFEGSVTAALWLTWIYFIMPVVTLVLWVIGIRAGYHEFFLSNGFWGLVEVLKAAGWVLLLIFLINLVWAVYNIRFTSGKPKAVRKYGQSVAPIAGADQLGKNNRIELTLDADGPKITSASVL